MNIADNVEIVRLRGELVDSMTDHLISCAIHAECGAGYTHASIERCSAIVDAFLTALDRDHHAGNQESILHTVKQTVTALNRLNNESDGRMIEHDQREQLCGIIHCGVQLAGMQTDDDVTQAWREW